MWAIAYDDDVAKRLKKYQKKWPHEIANVFSNLEELRKALEAGVRAEQLKGYGYVHSEPMGILAIDQKGAGKGTKMKEFRLYVFPREKGQVVQAIILGDKDTQQQDIALCRNRAAELIGIDAEKSA